MQWVWMDEFNIKSKFISKNQQLNLHAKTKHNIVEQVHPEWTDLIESLSLSLLLRYWPLALSLSLFLFFLRDQTHVQMFQMMMICIFYCSRVDS